MKQYFIAFFSSVLVFFAPIWGFILCLFMLILLDTLTGVLRTVKLKEGFMSSKFFAFVPKALIYFLSAFVFFLVDVYVLNSIIVHFIEIQYISSKLFILLIASVELTSIKENTEAMLGFSFSAIIKKIWKGLIQIKDLYKDIK